ncbi:UDP-N-acetylmuramate--L-alanine ligase [Dethiosulfatarculus sandiegensis]|uniref:UDP-N-acetylmuramate n=1 Tax=Dethiosulfatarculus sandiegensis TaxID=1429043 RepID=A0A0D2JRD9_9BACT|nr:Mur ligase family protein [Dethiosulfatarculus sandiegensis]KIX12020.1 UDP-N-acetylmuramate [Dethiosulfatarculus sandiegensis]
MKDLEPKLNTARGNINHIHLMGIGGVAMGALAAGLKQKGFTITGSDRPLYPPMSDFLAEKGISVAQGYDPANLEPRPDLVIVGNVIRKENPEAQALAGMNIPYLSLPQAVSDFFIRDRVSLVAAGTHGKTTTTALLAETLEACGQKTGFMVGGIMARTGRNFVEGEGGFFVTEGDEYDTAFFDKRPKFVHYRPGIGILSSCEFDHADIYQDFAAVKKAFDQFASLIPAKGALISWADSPEVMTRAARAKCKVWSYGLSPRSDWRLASLEPNGNGGADMVVITPQDRELEVMSPLAGEHNALNALAVIAALSAAGLPLGQISKGLSKFGGVKRRQEVRGKAKGVMVVDDFAHHPTAVRETVKAVKQFGLPGWPPAAGRLVAVFEPRTNTSKQNIFQKEYAGAFDQADLVFLREPPDTESLAPEKRFSSEILAQSLRDKGIQANAFAHTEELLTALLKELKPGDLCLIMSNGGFDNIHNKLLNGLGQNSQPMPVS